MTNKTDNWHKYIWKIENFSYCWHKKAECISSPMFRVEGVDWRLQIFPRGQSSSDYIACYLKRESSFKHGVSFKLSFLDPDGNSLVDDSWSQEAIFKHKTIGGYEYFVTRREVLGTNRMKFLPNDTLTVCCHISNSYNNSVNRNVLARTSIEVIWETITKKIVNLRYISYPYEILDPSASFGKLMNRIIFSEDKGPCSDGNLFVEIFCETNEQRRFSKCTVYLLDNFGARIRCGKSDIWFDSHKSDQNWKFPLIFSKFELMSNSDLYLSDHMLTLQFELSSSMGILNELTERIEYDAVINSKLSVNTSDSVAELGALQELGNLFRESILCDINLQTSTKTFPAHKAILSARSPVFKAMFTNDLKEKNTNQVDIDDLDDETVHRFLLYMYTNTVENLQWEDASNLYVAADKYNVVSLKNKCSAILQQHLKLDNLCEILTLADRHQDVQLKDFVQSYISLHDKVVIGSDEWRGLEQENPLLTYEMITCMYRKAKQF